MTYDFSLAIVQVTKLIDCTFSQCMPNLYCTAMTIIHIYIVRFLTLSCD